MPFLILFIIFIVPCLFMAFFQFSPNMPLFSGEDSFYHTGMAKFILGHGIVQKFPWLYFTHLNQNFIDHQLLFHLLLIPFLKIFGENYGPKIMVMLFFALSFVILYLIFKKKNVWFAGLITVFLLFLMPCDFYFRMAFIRVQSVSLFLMLLAFYLIFQKKYVWLFVISFLFVWLYGGSVFILFVILSYLAGKFLTEEKIDKKIILYGFGGFLAGIIINPYFPKNLIFLFSQVFQTGLGAKGYSGGEWQPYDAWYFVQISFLPLLLFFSGFILSLAKKFKHDGQTISILIFSIFLLILQLKSKRFVEYWPFFGTASGVLLLSEPLRQIYQKNREIFIGGAILFFVLALSYALPQIGRGYRDTKTPIDIKATKEVNDFLQEKSDAGDIVFTDDWDVFPYYFFYNRKNYYIVGLDPEFMNQYDSSLYQEFASISSGEDETNLERIKNDFKAKWVLIGADHPEFETNAINHPDLFTEVFKNEFYRLFRIN